MQPISIILADAQYLIRVGLRHLIDRIDEFKIIGEAKNGLTSNNYFKRIKRTLLYWTIFKPIILVKMFLKNIKTLSSDTKILIISSDDNKVNVYNVIEEGVNSFLTKQCDEEEILNAIRATAKGEKFFCSKVLNFILEKSFAKEETCAPSPLTLRECEVVRLVASGKIAKEIAAELNLSTHTVYTHRKNIMKKLQLSSPSELVLYAINNGLMMD